MKKIAINNCYGGFSLSDEGVLALAARKGITLYPEPSDWVLTGSTFWTVPKDQRQPELTGAGWNAASLEQRQAYNARYDQEHFSNRDIARDDADLCAVIEELGPMAGGRCAQLKVVEIPDDVDWEIQEYDGLEWVAEKHRTWG